MKDNPLVNKSRSFAVKIIKLCVEVKKSVITNQLSRCGTSIGANIHEANYAQSKLDFISKMQIALKECYETEYWLGLLLDAQIISDKQLLEDCLELRRLLIASIITAKIQIN
jgi:TIGR02436 family protein